MHKLNKLGRKILIVDLIIEAFFNLFSRHPSSKYSNSESHETNYPKTGGDGGKIGRFSFMPILTKRLQSTPKDCYKGLWKSSKLILN